MYLQNGLGLDRALSDDVTTACCLSAAVFDMADWFKAMPVIVGCNNLDLNGTSA